MPPKRQTSTRASAKQDAPPSDTEDAKAAIEPVSSEPGLPSDPLTTRHESVAIADPGSTNAASPQPSHSNTQSPASTPASARGTVTRGRRGRGRRDQAGREDLQRQEDEKKRTEEDKRRAEAEKRVGYQSRDNGRQDNGSHWRGGHRGRADGSGTSRGRGRGRYSNQLSRSNEVAEEAVPSGPFSAGQSTKQKPTRKRGASTSGISTGGRGSADTKRARTQGRVSTVAKTASPTTTTSDGKGVKQETGPSTDTKDILGNDVDAATQIARGIAAQDGGYISSDEETDGKGVQRMNVEDLGIADLTQDDAEFDPYAPVRVHRVAHKKRSLGINADGATNQEGAITVDANDIAAAQRSSSPSDTKKGKQKIKEIEVTAEKTRFQGTYSDSEEDDEPQLSIKPDPEETYPAGAHAEAPVPGISAEIPPPEPLSSPDSKRKVKEKIKAHEKLDYHTREEVEEWNRHRDDLETLRHELGTQSGEDIDGDTSMTGQDKRENKVYLFQFPPLLPPLQDPTAKTATTDGDQNDQADGMQIDNPITIKEDPDASINSNPRPKFPSGAVGKLKVHASGRVTLDWGGTSLCLGMGADASFAQELMLAKMPEEVGGEGSATSLGLVREKFVVTPDWEEILG